MLNRILKKNFFNANNRESYANLHEFRTICDNSRLISVNLRLRKFFTGLFIIFFLFITCKGLVFAKAEIRGITAKSAVVLDARTKKIHYSKEPHIKLPPASTTKVMTALCVLKYGDLDKKVIISKIAASQPASKINLKEGEVFLTKDLLKAILLNSANDASVALAESIAGSESSFCKLMNSLSRKLGVKNTNFLTATGLPAKGQYSTCYDLSLIMREALKDRRFRDIIGLKDARIKSLNGREVLLKNHNKMLKNMSKPLILGKTGYTLNAKHCFLGFFYNRKREMIISVLKSRRLWEDVKILVEEF